MLLFLWRIVTTRDARLLTVTVAVLIMMLLLCLVRQREWQQEAGKGQTPVRQALLVYPDEFKITGNFLSGVGKNCATNKKVALTMIINDEQTATKLQKMTRPVIWDVKGIAQPLLANTNENQFNYQRYRHHQGISYQVKVQELLSESPLRTHGLISQCHYWRACLSQYLATMPRPLDAYCLQLLVGRGSEETADLMKSVKQLGLLHLFCISGMHVVLITILVRKLLIYLWWEKETIDLVLILALPLYLVIGGGATSLIRATIMAEMALLHPYLHLDALGGWAVSLIAGLVVDPLLLLTLGGQLSYLLSFMLQVLPPRLSLFKQSLLLNVVSMPSILSYVYELHLLSFVASYFVIPVFTMVIFPAVIIAPLCYHFCPVVTYLVNDGLVCFQRLLDWLARLPGMIGFGKPPVVLGILLFGLSLVAISQYPQKKWWLVLVGTYILTAVVIHVPITGEVVFFDIGQGDSILIREPFNRRVLLIDTGGKVNFAKPGWAAASSTADDGERIVVNYLKSKGINHLDAIFLSHHDADHIGYLPSILGKVRVDQLIVPAGMEKQPVLLTKLALTDTQPQLVPVTDQIRLPRLPLQILHPFTAGEAKNEDSLVLAGRFGRARFVFTGDLDRENEQRVLKKYPYLRADILKLGHHGSKTASDPLFLRKLCPTYGIISAGRFNRYHHPDDVTIDNLHEANIIPVSTQQYGMIKYTYCKNMGKIRTYLKGDELRWTLPNCLNN